MYAIVEIAGQQFKVEKDQKIYVHRLNGEVGSKVDFDKVLLIENDKNITVGKPVIEGAMVYASILEHKKGDKVLVFKKKRKKGYRKLNGHRQFITQILIEEIIEKGAIARVETKKTEVVTAKKPKKVIKPAEKEVEHKTEPVVTEEKPVVQKTKKPVEKPVVKKTVKPASKAASAEKKASEVKTSKAEKPKAVKKTKEPVKEKKATDTKKAGSKKAK